MTLTEYLKQTETTMWQFSEITKIKIDTLNKYKYGNRIPNRENMTKILTATNELVQANDFYYKTPISERHDEFLNLEKVLSNKS
tara:strand:- start:1463 stop:1714 length:252 start_codon:yes stop_codon:yes gene_type:complete